MKTLLDVDLPKFVKKIRSILFRFHYVKEVYLFGSVIRNKITGASDLDILVIIRNKKPKDAYVEIAMALEDTLGDLAYLIDLHVYTEDQAESPLISKIISEAIQL